jgi:hypothetical protein
MTTAWWWVHTLVAAVSVGCYLTTAGRAQLLAAGLCALFTLLSYFKVRWK